MRFIDRASRGVVDGRRIGSGNGWLIGGLLGFLFGCFAAVTGGEQFAAVFMSAGGLCLVIGFWTRLFGALEQRMIEIQVAVLGAAAKVPAEDPQSAAELRERSPD